MEDKTTMIELAARIVAAYVGNNAVAQGELPKLIGDVHRAIELAAAGSAPKEEQAEKPAVNIKRSITPDFLICFEDGKKFKSLKRHLRAHYDLSPVQYREKWGLPADYPMVAPNYSASRSSLARNMGLGQRAGK